MLKKIFLLTISGAVFLIACSKDMSPITPDQPQTMRPLTTNEQYIADAAGDFGLDLFKSISASAAQDENLFISPLSVSMALGMTMNGADSSTYAAMRRTLGFEGLSEEEINEAYKSLITLMRVDRPFMFVLRERQSGTILFMGKILNPEWTD